MIVKGTIYWLGIVYSCPSVLSMWHNPKGENMKRRVLVVDDDPQVLKLFGKILEKGGYSTHLVSTGQQVMPLLSREAFDLLVLDLSMPPPDGFELLKQLRSSMPGLRILVTSGYMQGALLKAARLLGAAATLAKTDAPTQLLKSVDDLLREHPRRVPSN